MTDPDRTAAGEFSVQFFEGCKLAIDDEEVQVTEGAPWPIVSRDFAALGDISSDVEDRSLSPQRTQYETLEIKVLISCFRPGGQEADRISRTRAFELLGRLEKYFRMTDTTVGNTVLWCKRSHYEYATNPITEDSTQGRTTDLIATFTAFARITN